MFTPITFDVNERETFRGPEARKEHQELVKSLVAKT